MTPGGEKLCGDGLVSPKLEEEAGREGNKRKEPCHKTILRNIEDLKNLVSAELHETGAYEEVREVQQATKHALQQIDRAMQMARERERQREKTELYHRYGKMEAAITTERFNLLAEIDRLKKEKDVLRASCDAALAQLRQDRAQFGEERQDMGAQLAQREGTIAEDRARFCQEAQEREKSFSRQIEDREAYIASQGADLARLQRENDNLSALWKAERDTAATLRKKLEEEQEKLLCKICFTRPRDGLIFPCMHFEYCFLCLQDQKTRNNSCPTCRGSIDGLLKSNQLSK